MGFGEKNLLTLAPGKFVSEAFAGSGLLAPSLVVPALAGIVFVRLPLTFIVTLKVKVQFAAAARLAPLKANVSSPGLPESAPPQLPTAKFAGLAINIPLGRWSVKATPVSGTLFELNNSILSVEAEPPNTVNGLNAFTTPTLRLVMAKFAVADWEGLMT